jgi:hypothetical protein
MATTVPEVRYGNSKDYIIYRVRSLFFFIVLTNNIFLNQLTVILILTFHQRQYHLEHGDIYVVHLFFPCSIVNKI